MKRRAVIYSIFALLIGAAAASAAPRPEADATPRLDLADGWTLQSMSIDGEAFPALAAGKPTLRFKGREVSGYGGCNWFNGTAVMRGRKATFQRMYWTERACADRALMDQEDRYMKALSRITVFDFDGRDLVLSDGTADNRLRFSPTEAPEPKPLVGTRWVLTGIEATEGRSVSVRALVPGVTVDLRFDGGGGISGDAGVNGYSAACRIDAREGTIDIDGIGTTKKLGPAEAMQQESRYLNTLAKMTRFEIRGARLTLSNGAGTHRLLFEAGE